MQTRAMVISRRSQCTRPSVPCPASPEGAQSARAAEEPEGVWGHRWEEPHGLTGVSDTKDRVEAAGSAAKGGDGLSSGFRSRLSVGA